MMRFVWLLLVTSALAVPPDRAEDRAALVAIHKEAREAHLRGDASLLTKHWAAEIHEAREGSIAVVKRDELATMFQDYFKTAKYAVWDDTTPPVIRISPDGNMAWALISIRGKLKMKQKSGAEKDESFRSSWISVYEKQNGEWKMTAISSTVKPD